ncbi:MAG: hypothetical protein IIV19_05515 [Bacteroidaceae bacterium]|nr:hypothetical protein [Bacteroidaceae bacterium]
MNKERDESSCKRVSGSLLTFTTSAAEVRRKQYSFRVPGLMYFGRQST